MIRAVIVEDEPLAAAYLASLLAKTGRVDVVGIARDASWALTLSSDHKPDAVFLDVRMPGPDGLELARELRQLAQPPLVVFATGHADRACQAFRLEAVDYLLKPLEASQVWQAVSRLEARLAGTRTLESFPDPLDDRLSVKTGEDDIVRLIPRLDILAAIHHHRRTWIHTAQHEFTTYFGLSALCEWLGDPPFLRISRETVVNLQAVEEVIHYGDRLYQVRLRDREQTCVNASRSGSARLAALIKPPV